VPRHKQITKETNRIRALQRRPIALRMLAAVRDKDVAAFIRERLALAQRLLETTDQSIDRIASAAGFGSSVSLRQHFAAAFRVSPSVYRRTFRGDTG
ncbi:MAG: helix-turn-helix domain-containing protein, partial [Acidiferrobacteraceae bacterium]